MKISYRQENFTVSTKETLLNEQNLFVCFRKEKLYHAEILHDVSVMGTSWRVLLPDFDKRKQVTYYLNL